MGIRLEQAWTASQWQLARGLVGEYAAALGVDLSFQGFSHELEHLSDEYAPPGGAFGRPGRQAGDFHWVHNIAIESEGSVYTLEEDTGKRAQRFRRVQ